MRRLLGIAFVLLFLAPLLAQDAREREAEALRRIEELLRGERERTRTDLLETLRQELRGPAAPEADASARVERAKTLVTEDLLRKHAGYLASDELEGRAAGYPGNDKAAEYIARVMKEAGLKPGGDAGTYFQKFRVGGRETRNCVGLLEGTDPDLRKEYVVVGAHHDHVGTADQPDFGRLGRPGEADRIWNGADDNGSGTTTVLGVVRAFGEGGIRTRRTIVFMTFSGEEAGLLGSRHYTNNPAAPIQQHVFMLNLDMVGRNSDRPMEIYGVGSAEGGVLRRAAEKGLEKSGLKAKVHDDVKLVGGDSDHSSFAARRVPFTFFFSGFHADYHRVSDHAEKLAYANMVRVAHTSIHLLQEVADLPERPRWAGMARAPFRLPDPGEPPRPARRLGVTVQELDDAECDALKLPRDQGGLRVDEAQSGGVADKAGVKAGDVVLSLAGAALPRAGSRDKLRELLGAKVKPNEDVEIVVHREGRRVSLKARWSE